MEYAVIKTGGKQYRVQEGDVIEIDRLPSEKNGSVTFADVLLYVADGNIKVGTPTVADMKVKAKVLDLVKGRKVRVAKFKAKVRYRRITGFRAKLSRLQIEKIEKGKQGKVEVSV
jgi:large subunit ribosomal protein L21